MDSLRFGLVISSDNMILAIGKNTGDIDIYSSNSAETPNFSLDYTRSDTTSRIRDLEMTSDQQFMVVADEGTKTLVYKLNSLS